MKAAEAIPTEQRRRSSCGAACMKNAVRLLGTRVTEAKCRRLCGTTDAGTDELEIAAGLRALGYQHEPFSYRRGGLATDALRKHLTAGWPVIICVDHDDHWILACQLTGVDVVIHDPATGLRIVGEIALAGRWVSDKGEYYGMAVMPGSDETRKRAARQRRPDLVAIARRIR